jgi:hypothetical protein
MSSLESGRSPERARSAVKFESQSHAELNCSTKVGVTQYGVAFSTMEVLAPNATPLSTKERIRLGQLERIIERGINQFIEVGASLAEIRASRLYREKYRDFGSYCRERFALARSTCDQLIRSTETALLLASKGAKIPERTPEAVLRPVSALPSAELQLAGWKVIEAVSPERGPTQPIASKVCRTIRNAIEAEEGNGSRHKPRSREHSTRETPFLARPASERLCELRSRAYHFAHRETPGGVGLRGNG